MFHLLLSICFFLMYFLTLLPSDFEQFVSTLFNFFSLCQHHKEISTKDMTLNYTPILEIFSPFEFLHQISVQLHQTVESHITGMCSCWVPYMVLIILTSWASCGWVKSKVHYHGIDVRSILIYYYWCWLPFQLSTLKFASWEELVLSCFDKLIFFLKYLTFCRTYLVIKVKLFLYCVILSRPHTLKNQCIPLI